MRALEAFGRAAFVSVVRELRGPVAERSADPAHEAAAGALLARLACDAPFLEQVGLRGAQDAVPDLRFEEAAAVGGAWARDARAEPW